MPTGSSDSRKLVSDEVFEQLLTSVLAGDYAADEKLPTQRALAADLGVTMSSLREALKRLEQMGLIEARQGDAMRARDWRDYAGLDVIAHLVFKAGVLDRGLLEDVFDARGLMLRELAVLAASSRTDEQAERLEFLAAALNEADSMDLARLLDFSFFSELAQAAHNVVFVLMMNSIRELYLQQADLLPLLTELDDLGPLYLEIAAAIRDKDGDRAGKITAALADAQWQSVGEALKSGAAR